MSLDDGHASHRTRGLWTRRYLARVPRVLADDWRSDRANGRWIRIDLTVGAILLGAIAAVLTQVIPGPVVASALPTILVLLAVRPFRYTTRHPAS